MTQFAKKSLAVLLLAAVAACSGANRALPSAGGISPTARMARPRAQGGVLARIVGVGDSLTAGYQAGGFLGQTGVPNPLDPGTTIPPNQATGWWADLDEQASGLPLQQAIANEFNPAVSPLPLIKGPGLNNQIVPVASFPPFAQLKSGNTCTANNGFNAAGYLLSGLSRVRMNPNSKTLRDLGVPGITLHEANVLFQPQSSTCESLPGLPGLISAVVGGESSTFWPVLGNFAGMGQNLSMVKAAASLHPTLATVWLGANDVLKFMGSGGRFVGGDNSAAQAAADVRQAVLTLQYAGAKTVVANLPNVVETPYFQRVTIPNNAKVCGFQTYVYCILTKAFFIQPSLASQLVNQGAAYVHLNTSAACTPASTSKPCGYFTLQGTLGSLVYWQGPGGHTAFPDLDCTGPGFSKPCVPGSGLGTYYITPALAAKIQTLNDSINAGIDAASSSTNSALVNVQAIFHGITTGSQANPYFAQASHVNPGVCCTLTYGAGLVSFDGLHPSNTGYALISYYFIKAINQKYGTTIPEIDLHAAYAGTRCSNKSYCFPDPYAPPYNNIALKRWMRSQ